MKSVLFLLLFLMLAFPHKRYEDIYVRVTYPDGKLKVLDTRGYEERYVKVLYSSGKVGLVDTKKTTLRTLQARPDVVYVERPYPVKLLDDVVRSSSVVVAGNGNERFTVRTYNGQRLSLLQKGAENWDGTINITFRGSCAGVFDNMSCVDGVLEMSVRSYWDWRVIFQSFGKNMHVANFSKQAYYIGTGAVNSGRTGRGVLVGIIDTVVDYCHPAFRRPDGSYRVIYVCSVNRCYTPFYSFCERGEPIGSEHGTAVAGVVASIAEDADLVVVELVGRDLSTAGIMAGLDRLKEIKRQLGRPMVVNISLGTHYGPHDGKSLLDRHMSQHSERGFIIVAAAGNEGDLPLHMEVNPLRSSINLMEVELYGIPGYAQQYRAEFEQWIWYSGGKIAVEVCEKDGPCFLVPPGQTGGGQGMCVISIKNNELNHPLNGDHKAEIDISCDVRKEHIIKVHPVEGTPKVNAYVVGAYRVESIRSEYFQRDAEGGYLGTVGEPATSPGVLAVGAITSRFGSSERSFTDLGRIAYWSSRGPTRDGRLKPEIVAPGFYVLAPKFRTNEYSLYAGTSLSSPVVAGLIALMLEENPNLDLEDVKRILREKALKDSAVGEVPNYTYGWGKAFYGGAMPTAGSPPPPSGGDSGSGGGSGGGGSGGGGGTGGAVAVGAGGGGGGCSMGGGSGVYYSLLLMAIVLILRRFARRGL
ncbi:S8 family serine peptidase [Thermocrinis sp.]